MYLTIEDNPNCDSIEGRVFNEREASRPILQVLQTRQGKDVWCNITGLDSTGKSCPAVARKVDDSGDGTCYLVTGGAWGLRLTHNTQQWGESFLLLPGDGADLRFA